MWPLAGSLAINAALLGLLASLATRSEVPPPPAPIEIEIAPAPAVPTPDSRTPDSRTPDSRTPDSRTPDSRTARVRPADNRTRPGQRATAWRDLTVHVDTGEAIGTARESGGIEGGVSGGVTCNCRDDLRAMPPPPPPPPPERAPAPPSLARRATLIRPAHQEPIDDEILFVARVTIDEDGDVVGVHMIKTRPGARAEVAESAIWTFHYAPALDPTGKPTRSTFEQPFQIR